SFSNSASEFSSSSLTSWRREGKACDGVAEGTGSMRPRRRSIFIRAWYEEEMSPYARITPKKTRNEVDESRRCRNNTAAKSRAVVVGTEGGRRIIASCSPIQGH